MCFWGRGGGGGRTLCRESAWHGRLTDEHSTRKGPSGSSMSPGLCTQPRGHGTGTGRASERHACHRGLLPPCTSSPTVQRGNHDVEGWPVLSKRLFCGSRFCLSLESSAVGPGTSHDLGVEAGVFSRSLARYKYSFPPQGRHVASKSPLWRLLREELYFYIVTWPPLTTLRVAECRVCSLHDSKKSRNTRPRGRSADVWRHLTNITLYTSRVR